MINNECVVSGESCWFTPSGPNGEMQCEYCDAPKPIPSKPAIHPTIYKHGAINHTVNQQASVINQMVHAIFENNVKVGWWTDPKTGASIVETRNVPEMLMLIVSEIAEGMEGYRKNLMDDKLPHRSMLEVELADAVIRIFDLAGARGYDLGGAIQEKRQFNANRADHKMEARQADHGKKF